MNHEIFDFLFKYNRGAVIPVAASEKEIPVDKKYVYSANLKLSQEGFTMSKELLEACLNTTYNNFILFWNELGSAASKYRVLIESTKPIWPNFPEDAMEASDVELYAVNIIHFLTAGDWAPEFDIGKIAPGLLNSTKTLKVIPAAYNDSAAELIAEMYMRRSPLSFEEANDVAVIMKIPFVAESVRCKLQDKMLTCKESIILYTKDILYLENVQEDTVVKQIGSARDVLRLACVMSGGDVSLATVTHFKNFSRGQRRFLLSLLEKTSNIAESMSKNREEWKRLGEKLHPGEFCSKYPKVYQAFSLIRSNAYIETYESKLQSLMKQPVQIADLCQHLVKRPGVYARYFDFTLRNCKDFFSAYAVISYFESVAGSVDTRVLMQMANHFRNRSIGVQISTGKKSGASTYVSEKTVEEIPQQNLDAAVKTIKNVISAQVKNDEGEKIYIDPQIIKNQKIVFPVNIRHISSGEKIYASGSYMPIPQEMDVIRAFLYWKGKDLGGKGYENDIDLDLSVMFLDAQFELVDTIAYFSPSCRSVKGVHSGDIRYSGKNGSVEYVDFSINEAEKNKVAYAVIAVNSYSGSVFSELDSVFCGWMSRDGKTGNQFEPLTVRNRFDLTANSRQQASVLIDINQRRCYTVDMALNQKARYGNIMDAEDEIKKIAKRIVLDNSLTLEEVLEMTGRIVEVLEKADVIITENGDFSYIDRSYRIVYPWDATAVSQLFLSDEQ